MIGVTQSGELMTSISEGKAAKVYSYVGIVLNKRVRFCDLEVDVVIGAKLKVPERLFRANRSRAIDGRISRDSSMN